VAYMFCFFYYIVLAPPHPLQMLSLSNVVVIVAGLGTLYMESEYPNLDFMGFSE